MPALLVLAFALGLSLVTADCPLYNCGQLESGACIRVQNSQVTVNNSTCPSGTYCTYADATVWVNARTIANTAATTSSVYSTVYQCVSGSYELKPTSPDYLSCPARPLKKDLKDGSFPKQCTQLGSYDPLCQLLDNTISECACGLDGKSYCVPSIGASIYNDYWEECTTTGFRGSIASESHWRYWTLKMNLYLPYITGYSCAHKVFSEFSTIDDLHYSAYGVQVTVASLSLLALISA